MYYIILIIYKKVRQIRFTMAILISNYIFLMECVIITAFLKGGLLYESFF